MLDKIRTMIKKNNLVCEGDKILIACSGGTDSLALLDILNCLKNEINFFIICAHIVYVYRGKKAIEDAKFVNEYCYKNKIKIYNKQIDVPASVKSDSKLFYKTICYYRDKTIKNFFKLAGCNKIAFGHHGDDQVEFVFNNFLYDVCNKGILGLQIAEEIIIRPLLNVYRQEIEMYCYNKKLKPRIDKTNFEIKNRLKQIRLNLIPEIKEKYNPKIKESVCRTACIVADEHDFIVRIAKQTILSVAHSTNTQIFIKKNEFLKLHIAIQREIINLLLYNNNLKDFTFCQIIEIIEIIRNKNEGDILNFPKNIKKNFILVHNFNNLPTSNFK